MANGDTLTNLLHNLADVQPAGQALPTRWYSVLVQPFTLDSREGKADRLVFRGEVTEGEFRGARITDWWSLKEERSTREDGTAAAKSGAEVTFSTIRSLTDACGISPQSGQNYDSVIDFLNDGCAGQVVLARVQLDAPRTWVDPQGASHQFDESNRVRRFRPAGGVSAESLDAPAGATAVELPSE